MAPILFGRLFVWFVHGDFQFKEKSSACGLDIMINSLGFRSHLWGAYVWVVI